MNVILGAHPCFYSASGGQVPGSFFPDCRDSDDVFSLSSSESSTNNISMQRILYMTMYCLQVVGGKPLWRDGSVGRHLER